MLPPIEKEFIFDSELRLETSSNAPIFIYNHSSDPIRCMTARGIIPLAPHTLTMLGHDDPGIVEKSHITLEKPADGWKAAVTVTTFDTSGGFIRDQSVIFKSALPNNQYSVKVSFEGSKPPSAPECECGMEGTYKAVHRMSCPPHRHSDWCRMYKGN